MKTTTYTLPSYWASYLINGDASALGQVSWPNTGQTGSMRITIRRPRSSVVETEAGQVFEAKLMKLEAIFRGIE